MKIYDFARAPNARRVRMFAAEKGVEVEWINVDLNAKEQLDDAYRAINPRVAVPAMILDDGTLLTESVAICRYIEDLHPTPSLFGEDPKSRAITEMWHRRVELEGMAAGADGIRNSVEFFAGRALPGPENFEQIPALAERGKARVGIFFNMLDERLAASTYVAGEQFSVADITALVACDFVKVLKIRVGDGHPNLKRWYDSVSSRPSARV
jgi:glutathione S-transferase